MAFSALLAGASSIGSIGKSLGSIGGAIGIKSSKDDGRLFGNAKALAQVMAGRGNLPFEHTGQQGVTPLQFLLDKSPVNRGGKGGWATDKAQQDAWSKYQQAKTFMASQASATSSRPTTGNALGIGNSGSQTGKAVPFPGTVATSGGGLGEKTTGYVIVGAGILAALFLVRRK